MMKEGENVQYSMFKEEGIWIFENLDIGISSSMGF
jgi:hypothetical protein